MQNFVEALGDDGVLTGLEHPNADNDGVAATGQTCAGGAAAGAGVQFNTRPTFTQFLHDVGGGDFDAVLVVSDEEMRDVIGYGRNEGFGVDRGEGFETGSDEVGTLLEFGFEGGVTLAQEPIHGGDETDDFFLGDFHAAANGVGVGGIVKLGGLDEILAAEEETGALGTTKAFAAGESDEIKTHLRVIPQI